MGFDYTISGKEQGLTYIFLEQAKKQAGFDANQKIDWTKVMSVFDEIQKEEQAEGQSLFHGGTDKTRAGWGNSYQIWKGDRIQLSDEQMNRIYSAMGLDLSATTPTTASPLAAPPAQDQNPPAKGDDLSSTQIPLGIQFLLPYKSKAGQKIPNEDGTIYSYDENGYISEVLDEKGREIKSIIRRADGSVRSFIDQEYDDKGKVVRYINREPDGTITFYCDEEYDENGNETRFIMRKADGSILTYTDCIYDENGRVIREITRDSDGAISSYQDYKYDENGNKIEIDNEEE